MRYIYLAFIIIILFVLPAAALVDPGFEQAGSLYFPDAEYFRDNGGLCATTAGFGGLTYFYPDEPIYLSTKSEDELIRSCEKYIAGHRTVFGIDLKDLALLKIANRLDRWWVTFRQMHGDVPVLAGRVDFRVFGDGRMAFCGARIIEEFDISRPIIDLPRASSLLRGEFNTACEITSTELVYWPDISPDRIIGRLAWQIDCRESPEKHWRCFVSAADGRLLYRYNLINFYDVWGTGKLMYLPFYYDDPMDTAYFQYARISLNYFTVGTTDYRGNYSVSSYLSSSVPLQAFLSGDWTNVIDNEGSDGVYLISVVPPTEHNFVFSPQWADVDELNLYYHTNYIHGYYKRLDPTMNALDYPTPARAGIPSLPYYQENAFWDGYGANYGSGGRRTRNLALFANIIYHEYSHGITAWLYEGVYFPYAEQPGAMNEAFSDYFAVTICNDPRIGYKCLIEPPFYFRTMDNALRMPRNWSGEVHDDGRIFGGALWNLRERIGQTWTDRLVHFTRYATPNTFNSFVPECIFTDDDDSETSNGTPHFNEIIESFYLHGIGPGLFPKLKCEYEIVEIGDEDGYYEAGESLRIIPTTVADDGFPWPDILDLNATMEVESEEWITVLDIQSEFDLCIAPGDTSVGDPFKAIISDSTISHYTSLVFTYSAENGCADVVDTLSILIGHPQVLLVDDSPDTTDWLISFYRSALDNLNVTYVTHRTYDSIVPEGYNDYPVMIWFTGEDTFGETIDDCDTAMIAEFIAAGGNIILTGQNLTGQFAGNFLQRYFGAVHKSFGGSLVLNGIGPGPILSGGERIFLFGSPGASNQRHDLLTGISPAGGTPFIEYSDGDTCAICFDGGTYKSVIFGFGLEGIGGGGAGLSRKQILSNIFNWFELPIASVGEGDIAKPERLSLIAWPNPFNSAVNISLFCHSRESGNPEGKVKLNIFDLQGKMIAEFLPETQNPKPVSHKFVWQPDESIPSGVYLIRATLGEDIATARAVFIK